MTVTNTKLLATIFLSIHYSAFSTARIEGEWTLAKSPEAWVLTDRSAEMTSEAIERFGKLKEIIATELKIDRGESPRAFRTHYIIIPKSKDLFDKLTPFQSRSPNSRATGFYLQSDFNPLALSGGTSESQNWETIYHEFTHHVLHSYLNALPAWADEGLAELFSNLRFTKGTVQLSRSRDRTRRYEASMPAFIEWRSFFTTTRETLTGWIENDGSKAQAYYAQAALLAELTHFGRPELKNGYWQLVERSHYKPITDLDCQILLGISYIELQDAIVKQLRDSFSKSFPRTQLKKTGSTPQRSAPSSSVAAVIAIALSRSGKVNEAASRLAASPDRENPLWLTAKSEVSMEMGNTALALDFADQSIQHSSIDPFIITLSVMHSVNEERLYPSQALHSLTRAYEGGDTSRLMFNLYFEISRKSSMPFDEFAPFAKKGVKIHPDIEYARELNRLETARILKN